MASKYTHDIMFATEYTDRNGEKKSSWTRCGKAFTSDKGGLSLKLEFIPVGIDPNRGLWFQLFEPKPRDGQQSNGNHGSNNGNHAQDNNGDIPF